MSDASKPMILVENVTQDRTAEQHGRELTCWACSRPHKRKCRPGHCDGVPVELRILSSGCPVNKFKLGEDTHYRWGLKWAGAPFPTRVMAKFFHPLHPDISLASGCGCIIRLKGWTTKLWTRIQKSVFPDWYAKDHNDDGGSKSSGCGCGSRNVGGRDLSGSGGSGRVGGSDGGSSDPGDVDGSTNEADLGGSDLGQHWSGADFGARLDPEGMLTGDPRPAESVVVREDSSEPIPNRARSQVAWALSAAPGTESSGPGEGEDPGGIPSPETRTEDEQSEEVVRPPEGGNGVEPIDGERFPL